MAIIRWMLGSLILFFNWVFTPKGVKREPKAQAAIDTQTNNLTLYHYRACPFCVKVRRAMKRHTLTVETRDVKRSAAAKEQLLAGGGRLKVPCLRIVADGKEQWLYESSDIIGYLEEQFISPSPATS